MAFFKRERSAVAGGRPGWLALDRLDVRLLQSGAVALYHKHAVLAQDIVWLQQVGYRVYTLDAARWRSPADFHTEAREELGFPDYYGANLAGWIDHLGDLDVPSESGVALQFRHFDTFARLEPQFAHTLLDSIESTSRRFLISGRRLLALIQSDDPRIRFERVGAVPVNWNPREWLEADRGLRTTHTTRTMQTTQTDADGRGS
jgi:RNAse (barnase) inhibitor barstar